MRAGFLVGAQLKQTPVAPWNKKRAAQDALPVPPRGRLLGAAAGARAGSAEHARLARARAERLGRDRAGRHVGAQDAAVVAPRRQPMPGAAWVGKCDDDTFVHRRRCWRGCRRAPDGGERPRARALLGTIKWGCYANRRFKFERSCGHCKCGTSEFAKSRADRAADLHKTYEGPYRFALGWFYAMPFALNARLASCECAAPRAQFSGAIRGAIIAAQFEAQFSDGLSIRHRRYADWFHRTATGATAEPFLRKEDDPLNGHWLHKCLLPDAVEPLSSLGHEAHNMACISRHGLYRRPSNESIVVHFLKTPGAMQYVRAVLARGRRGEDAHKRTCCTRMVWPTAAAALPGERVRRRDAAGRRRRRRHRRGRVERQGGLIVRCTLRFTA